MSDSEARSEEIEKIPCPAIDDFAEVLAEEPRWFDLGIYLEIPASDLNDIRINFANDSIHRVLIEIYKIIRFRRVPVSWYDICEALLRLDNEALVERIRKNYIHKTMRNYPVTPPISERGLEEPNSSGPSNDNVINVHRALTEEFHRLLMIFTDIVLDVQRGLERNDINIDNLQSMLQEQYGLRPFFADVVSIERIFARLHPHYCFLNYRLLSRLTEQFLPNERFLQEELENYTERLEAFKDLPKVIDLMKMIKGKRDAPGGPRLITLKLKDFWGKLTLRKFERLIRMAFHKMYRRIAHLRLTEGCICATWIIPDIPNATSLLSHLVNSTKFMTSIGVLLLKIDDTVIFECSENEHDHETLEEAVIHSLAIGSYEGMEFILNTVYDVSAVNDHNHRYLQFDGNSDRMEYMYYKCLHLACSNGHYGIVTYLFDSCISYSMLDNNQIAHSLIPTASAETSNQNIVELLLSKSRLDPNVQVDLQKANLGMVSTLSSYNSDSSIGAALVSSQSDKHNLEMTKLFVKKIPVNEKTTITDDTVTSLNMVTSYRSILQQLFFICP